MIQRIQSIYLIIVAFLSGAMAFISESIIAIVENANEEIFIYLLVAILAIWSVLNYRKRATQLVLDNINIFLNVLLIGVSVYYLLTLPGGEDFPKKGIWLIVPVVNMILLVMANINIKKDIALVKSVDRIR